MTVEVNGYIRKLEYLHAGRWLVEVGLDSNRAQQVFQFFVKPEEVASYRPGMTIMIQMRPNETISPVSEI